MSFDPASQAKTAGLKEEEKQKNNSHVAKWATSSDY